MFSLEGRFENWKEKKRKEATDEKKNRKRGEVFNESKKKTGERIRLKRGAKRKNREGGFG